MVEIQPSSYLLKFNAKSQVLSKAMDSLLHFEQTTLESNCPVKKSVIIESYRYLLYFHHSQLYLILNLLSVIKFVLKYQLLVIYILAQMIYSIIGSLAIIFLLKTIEHLVVHTLEILAFQQLQPFSNLTEFMLYNKSTLLTLLVQHKLQLLFHQIEALSNTYLLGNNY